MSQNRWLLGRIRNGGWLKIMITKFDLFHSFKIPSHAKLVLILTHKKILGHVCDMLRVLQKNPKVLLTRNSSPFILFVFYLKLGLVLRKKHLLCVWVSKYICFFSAPRATHHRPIGVSCFFNNPNLLFQGQNENV